MDRVFGALSSICGPECADGFQGGREREPDLTLMMEVPPLGCRRQVDSPERGYGVFTVDWISIRRETKHLHPVGTTW